MEKATAQLWVKIIAILGYIGAAFYFLMGILLIFVGIFGKELISTIIPLSSSESIIDPSILGIVFIITGAVIIVLSVFELIISIKLWKHKNWARIVKIVFAVLGILSGFSSLPTGLISIALDGGVLYLLAFNKDIIKLFK